MLNFKLLVLAKKQILITITFFWAIFGVYVVLAMSSGVILNSANAFEEPFDRSSSLYLKDIKNNRKFSKFAKKGTLSVVYFPTVGDIKNQYVVIDNVKFTVDSNFVLRNEKNQPVNPPTKIVLPAQVAYIYLAGNKNANINRIWLLSDKEAANFEDHKFK